MAVSGSLLQTSLHNPLAAPDTLGITAGGELATVVALLGFGQLSPLAALVVATDAVGRWTFAPTEIPVGALIGIVGAPYFIYLVHRVTSVKRK